MNKAVGTDEYAPYYAGYIELVPDGNPVEVLEKQLDLTIELLNGITEEQALYRYAEGKWSLKEVIGHIADTERVMCHRILTIARGDRMELPGYDDNEYVKHASFDSHPLEDLKENLIAVRQSAIQLIKTLPPDALTRRSIANNHEVTVRALIAIISGHEQHHLRIIKERYLPGMEN
ncbi:DinB family protein [Peribacillus sp. SCS-37]|uniref:DinB family protein n=1 Tax=Paraperibacillus esterisolvens TaxID=3115296 RepID=UPI0039057FDA